MNLANIDNFIQDFIANNKKVHFIGIGGIGMSALALILHQYRIGIQGSDLKQNYLINKLTDANIKVFLEHKASNLDNSIGLIVKTSIIKDSNPEIIYAKEHNIPIITRADLLALLMQNYQGITVAGTHGKTTTTAMIGVLMESANLDPTIINGGTIHYFNSNYKIGHGKHIVAESDESDASFVKLPSIAGVITNIEPEHLDFAGYNNDFSIQKQYFWQYAKQIKGIVAVCIDSPVVFELYQSLNSSNIFSYSLHHHNSSKLWAENITCNHLGIKFDAVFADGNKIANISMPIYGKHNVSNALAAIAIANFLGLNAEQIKTGLAKFSGVKQRFTKVGEYQGNAIIDDYAHHPTEISATLDAARTLVGNKKLICIVEPHKFTRIRDLFDEFCKAFNSADTVIVSDIYSASQAPIEGINQDILIAGIKKHHQNVIKLESPQLLANTVKQHLTSDGLIICMGAGLISSWANNLEHQLKCN